MASELTTCEACEPDDDSPTTLAPADDLPTTLALVVLHAEEGPPSQDVQQAQPDCTICIGTSGATRVTMLGCGHVFCAPCISSHFSVQSTGGTSLSCPNCKRQITSGERPTVFPEGVQARARHRDGVGGQPPGQHPIDARMLQLSTSSDVRTFQREWLGVSGTAGTPATRDVVAPPTTDRERREFQSYARRVHLKRCPRCGAHVLKAGGCDHMSCRCGRRFNWSTAEPVVPCRMVHHDGWTLSTCRGCSPIARAKYRVARTGQVVLVEAPAAAVALAASAAGVALVSALAVTPAVVCGPLAVLYEPIRRLRGSRNHKNHFAKGAASGLIVPILVGMALFAEDDD
uniref:RING-type domain-containing protein n=1 Tax=Prymnesium polylepis TaxID=72548 RepID=A0A7S4HFA3_9EUKA